MKRYEGDFVFFEEDENGTFCKYEDVIELEKQNEELIRAIEIVIDSDGRRLSDNKFEIISNIYTKYDRSNKGNSSPIN